MLFRSTLFRLPFTGIAAKDVTHRFRRYSQEVDPRPCAHVLRAHELEICLMNERCGVESKITMPRPPLLMRKPAHLVVHEREKRAHSVLVSGFQLPQQPGDRSRFVFNQLGPSLRVGDGRAEASCEATAP